MLVEQITSALQMPWTYWYVRLIAIALLYGATVHIGNILGFTGTPWGETPLLWRSLDIILLVFNIVTAIGLWWHRFWSVPLLVIGIVILQWLPYTIWRSQFVLKPEDTQALNGLIGTEAILLILLGLLLWQKK